MDALELLKTWPGWSNAGAETVLASPAWRLRVRLGETAGLLRLGAEPLTDTVDLDIALDGEPHVLSLADSPLFPDLHLLWKTRHGLPQEILLALLEKECGALFALLEGATRRLLSVKGLAAAPSPSARRLDLELASGTLSVALDLPPEVRIQWGRLENLDTSHAVLRAQTRPAWAEYGALALTDDERAALAPGVHLLAPDGFPEGAVWTVDAPADDAVHLRASEPREIAFATFADDALPPVPAPAELLLVFRDQVLGTCSLSHLGVARTVRVN